MKMDARFVSRFSGLILMLTLIASRGSAAGQYPIDLLRGHVIMAPGGSKADAEVGGRKLLLVTDGSKLGPRFLESPSIEDSDPAPPVSPVFSSPDLEPEGSTDREIRIELVVGRGAARSLGRLARSDSRNGHRTRVWIAGEWLAPTRFRVHRHATAE